MDDTERPLASNDVPTQPHRDGLDASDVTRLQRNPADEDAKLDIGLDETFPNSDPPANVQPGKGMDPAPSSGFKG